MPRAVLGSLAVAAALLAVALLIGGRGSAPPPPCEECGAVEVPADAGPVAELARPGEPGTPLTVRGTVFAPDGRTPLAEVIVYAFHADAEGRYQAAPGAQGAAARHGRLRGWARTDARGSYELRTIRPAPVPDRPEPARIHLTLLPPGGREVVVDPVEFADDPRLTDIQRANRPGRGGSGIVAPEEIDGVLVVRRDLVLPDEALLGADAAGE